MRKQVICLLTILAVAGSFGAFAQSGLTIKIDAPFSFVAGAKTLPAGEYTLQFSTDEKEVIVRNAKTNETILLPVLTRLGQRSVKEVEAVFDVAGNEHYLAELHVPGIDGFAFNAAPGKHTHVGVKGKK